jgi:sugar-specific transcriptional regulator TrmB
MNHEDREKLEQMGLSAAEAKIYCALLKQGSLGASSIAAMTRIPRTSVYPTLCSLVDKGMVEGGAGYGSRFSAILPEHAFPSLIAREKEELIQRQHVANELVERLSFLAEPSEAAPEELIQVIRNPKVVAERFERLQLEAKRQIDSLIKAPFFCRPSNPAQEKAQKHGVRVRSLYERAVLDDASVGPYLAKWIAAGEEARVYDGELPHKLAIFDAQVVLMPLIVHGDQNRTVLIRHPQLAESLSLAFEFLWRQSEPLSPTRRKKNIEPATSLHPKRKQFNGSNSNH